MVSLEMLLAQDNKLKHCAFAQYERMLVAGSPWFYMISVLFENLVWPVSVPCSDILKVVTVKCGHCTGLLTVNLKRATFIPLHLLAPLEDNAELISHEEVPELPKGLSQTKSPVVESADNDEEDRILPNNQINNKPPEKRQRAPSAYNHFIKDEIKRIKAREPNITHKEAFSAAAKNWAHFPKIQHKKDGESCSHGGWGTSTDHQVMKSP
ncbi:hypothetical protein Syun_024123 [Stephania yunnanensis]|uniref:Axial regulator YABBY 4 n=1 Tax=Stephania yunnanensis TaxID=152371 RepID=A0AAP0FEI7_9MAGN